MKHKGFTLLELMIVVAVLGILIIIALPAYQNYSIRTKVSEGLNLAASAQVGVTEYLQTTGDWPIDNTQAGLASGLEISGNYTNSVLVGTDGESGVIAISYSSPPEIAGKSIVMVATATPGAVHWDCTEGTIPARYRPSVCRL